MDIQSLHNQLVLAQSEVPILSVPEATWHQAFQKMVSEYFGTIIWDNLDTSLSGIKTDVRGSENSPQFLVVPTTTRLSVQNYQVEGKLRTDSPIPGYLSSYQITFTQVLFNIVSENGKIFLVKEIGKYEFKADTTGDNRQSHIDYLRNVKNYTEDEINTLTNQQEPFAGSFLANGLLQLWETPFELFDFNLIFNGFRLQGEFDIRLLTVGNPAANYVSLQPKYFEKKVPTECAKNHVEESLYSSSNVNIEHTDNEEKYTTARFEFNVGTTPNTAGRIPNPNQPVSDIFLHLPAKATEELFSPSFRFSKIPISSSSGTAPMFPFFLDYKLDTYVGDAWAHLWDANNPKVRMDATLTMDLSFAVWLKILKIKTKICSLTTRSIYPLTYESTLIESFTGNADFQGQFYNEQNLVTESARFDSILPDTVDKLVSKIARAIFEFVLRKAVTVILTAAGFPLANQQGGQYFNANPRRNRKVFTRASQYCSSGAESATIGISFTERVIDG